MSVKGHCHCGIEGSVSSSWMKIAIFSLKNTAAHLLASWNWGWNLRWTDYQRSRGCELCHFGLAWVSCLEWIERNLKCQQLLITKPVCGFGMAHGVLKFRSTVLPGRPLQWVTNDMAWQLDTGTLTTTACRNSEERSRKFSECQHLSSRGPLVHT